jgi:hypothetical protein
MAVHFDTENFQVAVLLDETDDIDLEPRRGPYLRVRASRRTEVETRRAAELV